MVIDSLISAVIRLFDSRAWWVHVTVNPEARRIAVFSSGTLSGSIVMIPIGGQVHPSSGTGARLLWKNVQKKARKKQISLIINSTIPRRSLFCTYLVCFPIYYVASRIRSRHH